MGGWTSWLLSAPRTLCGFFIRLRLGDRHTASWVECLARSPDHSDAGHDYRSYHTKFSKDGSGIDHRRLCLRLPFSCHRGLSSIFTLLIINSKRKGIVPSHLSPVACGAVVVLTYVLGECLLRTELANNF